MNFFTIFYHAPVVHLCTVQCYEIKIWQPEMTSNYLGLKINSLQNDLFEKLLHNVEIFLH